MISLLYSLDLEMGQTDFLILLLPLAIPALLLPLALPPSGII